MDNATIWKIIDTYFHDNPQALVRHHIDSYNDFFKTGIYQIFKEKNPIILYSRLNKETGEYASQCNLYMGGNGDKLYFGKPVIYDQNPGDESNVHYMFPNEARLRNMTYGMTIHYDIEVEFIDRLEPGELPTVIGQEMDSEIRGGGIVVGGDEADLYGGEENESEGNYKIDGLTEAELKEGEIQDPAKSGGAPKPVTIKRSKKTNVVPLEMTTASAQRIREATEKSLQKRIQARKLYKPVGKH